MAFTSYNDTLRELLTYDIGRSAYFDVAIFSNEQFIGNKFSRNLPYLCHAAELPGESVATVSQKIYGVVEKHPIMASYSDITLSFYTRGNDADIVRYDFLTWLAKLTGRNKIVSHNGVVQSKETSETTYNIPYKKDISGNIIINHYSSGGELLTSCQLYEAFPIAIEQTPLSWSMANHAISINVTFAYTEYKYQFYKVKKRSAETIPVYYEKEVKSNASESTSPMSDINVTSI